MNMDFEKEAREIAKELLGTDFYGEESRHDIMTLSEALRRAFAAGEKSMRERAAYVVQAWEDADLVLTEAEVARRDNEIVSAILALPLSQPIQEKV
jgi:hypothetical protein